MENLKNIISTLCGSRGQDQADEAGTIRADSLYWSRCYLKEPYLEVDFGLNLYFGSDLYFLSNYEHARSFPIRHE